MTRITIRTGDQAPVTLEIAPGLTAPIHLHLGDTAPASPPATPIGTGTAALLAPPAPRNRRRLGWIGAVCAVTGFGVVLTVVRSGPGDAMPPASVLPPLPGGAVSTMIAPEPRGLRPAPTLEAQKAQILAALGQPATPSRAAAAPASVAPASAAPAGPAPAAPSAPSPAASPFGLEN